MNQALRKLDVDDFYFLAYMAEGLTMAQAAEKMGLSHPALCQRRSKIEEALNVKLTVRPLAKVDLTAKGAYLARQMIMMIRLLETAVKDLDDIVEEEVTVLRGTPHFPKRGRSTLPALGRPLRKLPKDATLRATTRERGPTAKLDKPCENKVANKESFNL